MTRLLQFLRFAILNKTDHPRRSPRRRAWNRGPARDESYKAFIRRQPCCACGRMPAEAAHTGIDGGMGQKASDYSCVPLCFNCHTGGSRSYHRIGIRAFELRRGIDFDVIIEGLFTEWSARQ
jgi:hypothetical protein